MIRASVRRAPTRDRAAAPARRLEARVAARLRAAGVVLPDADLRALSDALLADAVRVALDWLEPVERADHA